MSAANNITVPPPDEIRQRIQQTRAELQNLRKLLKLSNVAVEVQTQEQRRERQAVLNV